MADNLIVEQLRAALERRGQRPPHERWEELVRRGAIDAEGRVLIRGPEGRHGPPKKGGVKKGK